MFRQVVKAWHMENPLQQAIAARLEPNTIKAQLMSVAQNAKISTRHITPEHDTNVPVGVG